MSESKKVKVLLDSKEINYFIVDLDSGRIEESGDTENPDTWEEVYVKVGTIEEGKKLTISYNSGIYSRKYPNRKAVWTELKYDVLKVIKIRNKIG